MYNKQRNTTLILMHHFYKTVILSFFIFNEVWIFPIPFRVLICQSVHQSIKKITWKAFCVNLMKWFCKNIFVGKSNGFYLFHQRKHLVNFCTVLWKSINQCYVIIYLHQLSDSFSLHSSTVCRVFVMQKTSSNWKLFLLTTHFFLRQTVFAQNRIFKTNILGFFPNIVLGPSVLLLRMHE